MASQDYISQFSQGIPPTQPDRPPSRTPRRDISTTPYETSVPAFRGPLHTQRGISGLKPPQVLTEGFSAEMAISGLNPQFKVVCLVIFHEKR